MHQPEDFNFISPELLSEIVISSEKGVILLYPDSKIFWVNQGYLNLTGFKKEEIIGKTPFELWKGPETKRDSLLRMMEALRNGKKIKEELKNYRKDCSFFWGNISLFPIKNIETNKFIYCLEVEDISDKVIALEKIEQQELKYGSIIANMNLGLIEVDLEERIRFVNQSFCDLCGYSSNELMGEIASQILLQGPAQKFMEQIKERRSKGISDAYELPFINKKGEQKWWLISGAPRFDKNGEMVGSIGIHLEITDQKNLEIELIKARKEAEQSARTKEIFLANMSHEIRTPMNAIMEMARLISKTNLNSKQQFQLSVISSASDHLLVVINDILDISKIEAGKLSVDQVPFTLVDTILRTIEALSPKAEEHGLELITGVDPTLPKVLMGDPYRLNQILFNLIGNSLKFTQEGSVSLNIKNKGFQDNKYLIEIQVNDTGVGMTEEFLSRIFENFTQEDDLHSRNYGGSGLGMAITKNLVELMGGTISIESEKNQGTKVTVLIPLAEGQIQDHANKLTQKEDTGLLAGKKVLLVEDNEMNRLVALSILENYGVKITEATNGLMALDLIEEHFFDLILMDIQMPKMNGYTAAKIIRSKAKFLEIPIIALTANAISGEKEKCIEAGMNDFVSKPFDESELIQKVAFWTGGVYDADNLLKKELEQIPNNSLFRWEKLEQLAHGNSAFIQKMVAIFLKEIPQSLAIMKVGLENKKIELIRSQAHKMKPALDNLEILSLRQIIRELEKSDPVEWGRTNVLVNHTEEVLEKVCTELKKKLDIN